MLLIVAFLGKNISCEEDFMLLTVSMPAATRGMPARPRGSLTGLKPGGGGGGAVSPTVGSTAGTLGGAIGPEEVEEAEPLVFDRLRFSALDWLFRLFYNL